MSMSRRSPRDHQVTAAGLPNLRVKAASVGWSDSDFSLQQTLISALETNKRWRIGLFSTDTTTPLKIRCYDEIARALFATHPYYATGYRTRRAAFAKAVKEQIDALPDVLASSALNKARTRSSKAKITQDLCSLALRRSDTWTRHRISQNWASVQWQPRLPLEIQLLIMESFIQSDNCAPPPASEARPFPTEKPTTANGPSSTNEVVRLDHRKAAVACLVNQSWYTETVRLLYSTVTITRTRHYDSLFTGHGAMHRGRAGEHTKVLRLLTPPNNAIQLCIHRSTIPYVQFDFGSSKVFFERIDEDTGKPIQELGRTAQRIAALATCSVPLYQLTLCLEAKQMRLFVSEDHPVDGSDDIWQDLIAGHVAALRMMVHLDHLIIDAELYLILLPNYFKTWCLTEMWQQVLTALQSEASVKPMATFFDETHLTTLTFVGRHVPTLAFLARISCAPKVANINLVGWNQPGMSREWADFIKTERLVSDRLCNWSTADADTL